jgi:hypothetical protein
MQLRLVDGGAARGSEEAETPGGIWAKSKLRGRRDYVCMPRFAAIHAPCILAGRPGAEGLRGGGALEWESKGLGARVIVLSKAALIVLMLVGLPGSRLSPVFLAIRRYNPALTKPYIAANLLYREIMMKVVDAVTLDAIVIVVEGHFLNYLPLAPIRSAFG